MCGVFNSPWQTYFFADEEDAMASVSDMWKIGPDKSPAKSRQVGGDHYKQHDLQPWDIIEVFDLDFWEGNCLKYLLRKKDNRLQDLQKARHYLDYLIEREENA
jgi:hypothetical protein